MTMVIVTWYPKWLPYFVVRRSESSGKYFVLKHKEIFSYHQVRDHVPHPYTARGKLQGDNTSETE